MRPMPQLHDLTSHQMTKMLRNLDGWIVKAIEHAQAVDFDADKFVGYALAPDMFTFGRQVQAACDAAKLAVARLADVQAPVHEDTETTLAQLRARIAAVIAFVEGVDRDAVDAGERREIQLSFLPGKAVEGDHYLVDFAQANFYFHVTTAYAILRHGGVRLGKRDFIGHLRMHDAPE